MKKLLLVLVLLAFSFTTNAQPVPPPPGGENPCDNGGQLIFVPGYWTVGIWGGVPYPLYIEPHYYCDDSSDTGGDDEDEGGPLPTKG